MYNEQSHIIDFQQLEKVLAKAALDPNFAAQLRQLGTSAKARFACDIKEGQILDLLLELEGAGLQAILNVIEAGIDTRLAIVMTSIIAKPNIAQSPVSLDDAHRGILSNHAG